MMHEFENAMMRLVGLASDASNGNQRVWEADPVIAGLKSNGMSDQQILKCQQRLVQQGLLIDEEGTNPPTLCQFILARAGMQWWLHENDRPNYIKDLGNIKQKLTEISDAQTVASELGLDEIRVKRIIYAEDLLSSPVRLPRR